MDNLHLTFGQRLRETRERQGLKQGELAKLVGVKAPSVITNWEADTNKPDIDKLVRLCAALSITPGYLLGLPDYDDLSCTAKEIAHRLDQVDSLTREEILEYMEFRTTRPNRLRAYDRLDEVPDGIYLSPSDPDYDTIREKCKTLNALKGLRHRSISDVTKFLLDIWYTEEEVCTTFIYQVFAGVRVPNRQLYERILAYCTGDLLYSHSDGSEL